MPQSNRDSWPGVWLVGGRDVSVSNLDKVFWPEEHITKGELLEYYRDVGPMLLPYIQHRPLVMKPFPEGVEGPHYFRQNIPKYAPEWLERFETVPLTKQRSKQMPVVNDMASLIWLVNQAAIELHPWLSTVSAPQRPDFAVFDLDVAAIDRFPLALDAALVLKRQLDAYHLRSFPKTSGGSGVHIYVPLDGRYSFEETHAWVRAFAQRTQQQRPELISVDTAKSGRVEKVLLDYAQNSFGKTTVAPYSVRPRPGATISAPLSWDEVEAGTVTPRYFTLRTMRERLQKYGELFSGLLALRQQLPVI